MRLARRAALAAAATTSAAGVAALCEPAPPVRRVTRSTSAHPDAVYYAQLEEHRLRGLSVLQEAQLGEWYEVVRKVEAGRAELNEADPATGATVLHLAAQSGKRIAADALLRAGADCGARDARGASPCAYAMRANQANMLQFLLGHPHCPQADVNERDNNGATLLHRAAATGAHGMVRRLLQHPHIAPNEADQYGTAPLHKAVAFGHEKVVTELLADVRVDVNLACAEPSAPSSHGAISGGESALHIAAGQAAASGTKGALAIARALIASGADTRARDKKGRTPAHCACAAGNEPIVRALVRARDEEQWAAVDNSGRTPLEVAKAEGHARLVKLLRESRLALTADGAREDPVPPADAARLRARASSRAAAVARGMAAGGARDDGEQSSPPESSSTSP